MPLCPLMNEGEYLSRQVKASKRLIFKLSILNQVLRQKRRTNEKE